MALRPNCQHMDAPLPVRQTLPQLSQSRRRRRSDRRFFEALESCNGNVGLSPRPRQSQCICGHVFLFFFVLGYRIMSWLRQASQRWRLIQAQRHGILTSGASVYRPALLPLPGSDQTSAQVLQELESRWIYSIRQNGWRMAFIVGLALCFPLC